MLKYFMIFVVLSNLIVNANEKQLTGIIEGTVLDKGTKMPLIAANIMIENSTIGATTDIEGKFVIKGVKVGNYNLKISYIGYQPIIKTDVIVKSGRSTVLLIELQLSSFQTDEVNVKAGYFNEVEYQSVNSVNFSYEEIRRSPGAAGDVSRIMMSLPSVAKVNDQSNSLIVRGGSPLENAFYIDNVEIPNINHFPTQGASGGPIGVLNVDFINDVNFLSGGFASTYGDKLSSVMDIKLREGNRENIEGQLDLNFIGFGGVIEGPLGNNGSYMVSLRRSYFDLLVKSIDIGTSIPPSYGDYQYKIVYNLNENNKLWLIGVVSDDHNNPTQKAAIEEDMIYYGPQKIWVHTNGINWQRIWGKIGYSNTSVSFTSNLFDETFYETGSGLFLRKNDSYENELKIRNINYLKLFDNISLTIGADYKWLKSNYNNLYGRYTDALGNITPEITHNASFDEHKISLFEELKLTPVNHIDLSFGVRGDYFTYNKRVDISPRVAVKLKLDEISSIKAFAGVFYQTLPSILLSQNDNNK
nr:TonB-dependent receptor [Melioribacteraceae bacterium]